MTKQRFYAVACATGRVRFVRVGSELGDLDEAVVFRTRGDAQKYMDYQDLNCGCGRRGHRVVTWGRGCSLERAGEARPRKGMTE